MSTRKIDLSIVIPAWNESKSLGETTRHINEALLANGTGGFSWEIIVCDNASTDGTATIAQDAGARVVFEPERGIARARNAGAAIARGKWLLFIDADSYPPPELLSDVRTLSGEPGIVGCGATMTPVGGNWLMRYKIRKDSFVLRLLGLCTGVFILCQREAFQAIEGFSTALYAGEELDFIIRLRRYGRRNGLKFRVLHQHPVVTSARAKGGFVTMVVSNVVMIALLLQHTLLPKRLRVRGGRTLLRFWYPSRRYSTEICRAETGLRFLQNRYHKSGCGINFGGPGIATSVRPGHWGL